MSDVQTIDKLAIEITSNIKGQSKIEKFSKALDDLAKVSQNLNTSNLSASASSLKSFSSSLKGLDTKGVKNLSDSLSRLASVKVNTQGLASLGNTLKGLSNISNEVKGIKDLTNALYRLANASMGNFDFASFDRMANGITRLASSLSGVQSINANVARVVSSIASLSNSGKNINAVSIELPKLGKSLVTLVRDIQSVGTIDVNMAKLVSGIAQLANAGKKAVDVANSLDKFGDAVVRLVQKLQGAGTIDTNLANTIHGLGNLAQSGYKFNGVATSMTNNVSRLGNGFKKLGSAIGKANGLFRSLASNLRSTKTTTNELASKVGLLYAKYFLLMRLARGFGHITSSAQDYIEAFNYFNVALQKIGQDSKDQYKRFGYDNAEAYAESFQDRFKKLQKQMTGFDINSRTGDLTYKAGRSLGLNATDVMQYQAQISQITNSTGQLGEVSVMAAKAMSMLSADFSSLTNTDLTQVQENFMSALNGQTRAVYKYGVNLTSASLQQIAYNHGISDSIVKLDMATKQQLRLIGMLEQSKVAFGDLGRTISQPANQLRMLKAGFVNLGRTIGSIFLPALQAIYPILNGIVMVLQEFFGWIAKILGVKLPDMSSALSIPDLEEPADNSGDLANNLDKSSKKAKKLHDNLQGFDEINKLEKNSDSDNSGNKTPNGIKGYDLSSDLAKLLKNYEKIWNKAFKSSDNLAYKWAQKIKESLLKGWKNGGDFTFLGKEFGELFSKTLAKIPWAKIQNGVNKVTRAFATFLNGVIKGTDWNVIGNTIAQFFNTIIGAMYTWYDEFDFLELGRRIAQGINSFINKFDWKKFGAMLGKKLRAMIQFAFGFVTNFDYNNLINKAFEGIQNFFSEMDAVDSRTGLNGWQEFEKGIAKAVNSLVDAFASIYEKIDFLGLGERIAKGFSDLINDIDWVRLGNALGEKIRKWIQLAFGFITSIDFENVAKKITESINSFFTRMGKVDEKTGLSGWQEAGKSISDGAKGMLDGIYYMLDNLDWDSVAKAISDFLGAIDWVSIFLKLGRVIVKALWEAIKTAVKAFANDPIGVGGAIVTVLGGLFAFGKLKSLIGVIKAGFGSVFGLGLKSGLEQGVAQAGLSGAIGSGGGIFSKAIKGFKSFASKCVANFKSGLKFGGIKGAFKGLWATLVNGAKNTGSKIASFLKGNGGRAIGWGLVAETGVQYIQAQEEREKAGKENIEEHRKGGAIKANEVKALAKRDGKDLRSAYNDAIKEAEKKIQELNNKKKTLTLDFDISPLSALSNQVSLENFKTDVEEINADIVKEQEKINKLREMASQESAANYKRNMQAVDKERESALKRLKKLVDTGKISWYDYAKAQKTVEKNTGTTSQLFAEAISKTDSYRNTTRKLTDDMTKAKVPYEQQQGILKNLKQALGDGRISLKQYKDIVDKSKGSADKLAKAIQKIPARKTTTLKFSQSGFKSIQSYLKSIPRTIPINVKVTTSKGSAMTGNEYRSRKSLESIMGSQNYNEQKKHGKIKFLSDGTIKLKKDLYNIYAQRFKDAGYKVKRFKQGGFLDGMEDGLFTMNKGEIAGKFNNGKSVVANNEQITEGFAQSITQTLAPAIYSAVKQAVSETNVDDRPIKVYLDGKQLADSNVKYIRQMNRSNGKSVFA